MPPPRHILPQIVRSFGHAFFMLLKQFADVDSIDLQTVYFTVGDLDSGKIAVYEL